MRIITGDWKGRRLKTVRGMQIRPTADKVKGGIFNILGSRVIDAVVLDLFAGTGSLSFEALSRGAAKAVLIEKNFDAFTSIKENMAMLEARKAQVHRMDAFTFLNQKNPELYDLIFIDPPYRQGLVDKALTYLKENLILRLGGIIVAETAADEVIQEGMQPLEIRMNRVYGDTKIWFIQETRE